MLLGIRGGGRSGFAKGLAWNFSSFLVGVAVGLFINVILAHRFGAETLGLFNKQLAFLNISSALVGGGAWLAVLQFLSKAGEGAGEGVGEEAGILGAGVLVNTAATAVSCALIACVSYAAHRFGGYDVSAYLTCVVGVVFQSYNRVFVSSLYAARDMRRAAIVNVVRYSVMFVSASAFSYFMLDSSVLPLIIVVPEIVAFALNFFFAKSRLVGDFAHISRKKMGQLFGFGIKGIWSVGATEIYNRMDIILLAILVSDRELGIYSFAGFFYMGLITVCVPIRDNFNPTFTSLFFSGRLPELQALLLKSRNLTYLFFLVVCSGIALVVPFFVTNYLASGFAASNSILLVLVGGFLVSSGFVPFNMFVIQAGFPVHQSMHRIIVLVFGLLLNFAFIHWWGAMGAACAMVLTLLFSTVFYVILSARLTGIRMV